MIRGLRKILEEVGLSDKESRIYLAALELSEASVLQIAKRAKVKRPTAYLTLEALSERGLVGHVKRSRGTFYRALSPWTIVDDVHRRFQSLKKALPDLESLALSASKPQMSIFEGREGIRHVIEDSLTCKGELLSWANIPLATTTILRDLYPGYIERRVAKKIFNKEIAVLDSEALKYQKLDKAQLRELRLIPKEKFPFSNKINIYNDKISIVEHNDALGVIIQNQAIADSQKAIFHFAFEYAGILQEQWKRKG